MIESGSVIQNRKPDDLEVFGANKDWTITWEQKNGYNIFLNLIVRCDLKAIIIGALQMIELKSFRFGKRSALLHDTP